jgi:putative peptidoglycan lipid II flippase
VKVLAPAFYALDDTRVPLLGSVLGMGANVALNAALYPVLGFRGVALGTSLAAAANVAVLGVAWRRHGGLREAGLAPHLGRVVAACVPLALAAWASWRGLERLLPPGGGLPRQLVLGLVPVAAGAAAYLAAARALGIRELDELLAALRRRRAR